MGQESETAMRHPLIACLVLVLLALLPSAARADEATEAKIEAWLAAYDALPPNPVTLTVTADAAKTVKATIGVKGGRLKLETPEAFYELEIPEGAFLYPVEVTMAPLQRVEGLGEKVTGVLGVKLGPDGMELWDSAWLAVRPKAGGTLTGFFPFAFFGDGQTPHYGNFVRAEDGSIFLQVTHFSGYGAALGTVASEVLNQAKPDPEGFGTEYGNPLRALWGGVVDATAGETDVKTGGETIEDVINRRMGDSWKTGGAARKRLAGQWPQPGECGGLDGTIKFVTGQNEGVDKARQENPNSPAAKLDKIPFEPSQWRTILACAKPPIAVCFGTGNPKPLVAYIKQLKAYRPEAPEEQARMGAVREWLDENLKACAAYEMRIDSDSEVKQELAQIGASIYFDIPFKLDLNADRIVATGKAEVLSSRFTCKVKRVKCELTEFAVTEQPKVQLSLADLPFFDPKGALDPAQFKPKITPGFTRLDGKISAQGIQQTIPFEIVFAMWWCHYKSEYTQSGNYFELKGWTEGTYPNLFTLDRPSATKTCEGVPGTLRMLANFRHKPAGEPVPEPVLPGLPPQ
jgi:hypothetical protein